MASRLARGSVLPAERRERTEDLETARVSGKKAFEDAQNEEAKNTKMTKKSLGT